MGIVNTFVAVTTIDSLKNATNTTKPMFGGDIELTSEIIEHVLTYENKQRGLNLTSEQHGTFIQVGGHCLHSADCAIKCFISFSLIMTSAPIDLVQKSG